MDRQLYDRPNRRSLPRTRRSRRAKEQGHRRMHSMNIQALLIRQMRRRFFIRRARPEAWASRSASPGSMTSHPSIRAFAVPRPIVERHRICTCIFRWVRRYGRLGPMPIFWGHYAPACHQSRAVRRTTTKAHHYGGATRIYGVYFECMRKTVLGRGPHPVHRRALCPAPASWHHPRRRHCSPTTRQTCPTRMQRLNLSQLLHSAVAMKIEASGTDVMC